MKRLAPVLLPLAFFLAVTWTAADFGFHWDEPFAQIRPLKRSLERGTLLPGYYIYPGLNYWLNRAALAPELLAAARAGLAPEAARQELVEAVESQAYLLRARRLRMVLASLAIPWVYLLALALRRSVAEALLAAALLAVSWEVVYHSRWLAPDSVLMQLGVLAVLCAVLAERQPRRAAWPLLAAVAAGLGCGMKYPGGLLLLPVGLVVWRRSGSGRRARLTALGRLGAVFGATYLATTPGTLLEFREFKSTLLRLSEIYSQGWHGYTVESPHYPKLLAYLAAAALSPHLALALTLFAGAAWGGYRLLRTAGRPAWITLAFPLAYAAYFGLQKVMIVRNYQILLPFVALCAAVGIGEIFRRAAPAVKAVLAVAVAAALAYNAGWQVTACRGIRERTGDGAWRQLAEHVDRRPGTRFFVSARVAQALAAVGGARRPNVTREAGQATVAVFALRELGGEFPANRPHRFKWFGPHEVNLNYYPSWEGQDRPLLLPMAKAVTLPLVLSLSHPGPPDPARLGELRVGAPARARVQLELVCEDGAQPNPKGASAFEHRPQRTSSNCTSRSPDAGFRRAFSGSLHLPPVPAAGPQRGQAPWPLTTSSLPRTRPPRPSPWTSSAP